MTLIGIGLIAFIAWVARFMSQRNATGNAGLSSTGLGGFRPAYPNNPYGGGNAPGGYGMPGAAPATGLGSQMLGGLATGAAVGAGVVAGEALMRHFFDGNKPSSANDGAISSLDIPELPSTPMNDMGGSDFGISDSSSWDDGDAGGSDWN